MTIKKRFKANVVLKERNIVLISIGQHRFAKNTDAFFAISTASLKRFMRRWRVEKGRRGGNMLKALIPLVSKRSQRFQHPPIIHRNTI